MRTKPFRHDGEEVAEVVRWQSIDGAERIDVNGLTLKPREARRLAAWLLRAAAEVAVRNHRFNWRRRNPLASLPARSSSGVLPGQLSFPLEADRG